MAWRRIGEKPLSDPMLVNLLTHICVTRPQWVNTCPFPNFHCGLDILPLKIRRGRFITSHKTWLLQFEYTLNCLTYFVLLFPIDAILTLFNHTCYHLISWWRHQIETFSTLLAIYAGNSPVTVNFPHKSQWRGALMFSLICAWINDWVNNGGAVDLRRHRAHYDVTTMWSLWVKGVTGRCKKLYYQWYVIYQTNIR